MFSFLCRLVIERIDKSKRVTLNSPKSFAKVRAVTHIKQAVTRDRSHRTEDVWKRWLEHDPYHMVEHAKAALDSLNLIYIDAGNSDEFNLDIGAKALSKKLNDMGAEHTLNEFDGGHFSIKHRYEPALEAISSAFEV